MKVWKDGDIIIYNSDFPELTLSKKSVDLIITSPPYNIGIDYGTYDDNKSYREYLEFSKKWFIKCFGVLVDGGRLCINIPIDTGKDTKRSLAADIILLAKRAGFRYKGTIIWDKQNITNYSMAFSKNIEVILIFYKDIWKPVKREFSKWVNEIWKFSGESKKRVGHPAPFPVEVPRRLIKMFSNSRDVVMDPFLGSGTTMVACKLYGRKGIGVEIDEEYFDNSCGRIKNKKW